MRTLVAVATAGMLAVSGATVATVADTDTASASVAAPAASITFGACQDESLKAGGAECGFVSVPLDWAKPAGEKIQIAVSRLKSTEKRQGVVLINPGGPGGSGLGFATYLPPLVPNGVGKQYDWIGFDPRGVGASRPAISCQPDYFNGPRPAYRPDSKTKTAANEAAWIARTKKFAKACLAQNGDLIRHMHTSDTLQDMDAIRQALGEKQINYYGFSYGTFLGQAYATRYPTRVRRMVLDGNVEPTYGGYGDGGKGQTAGFQNAISEFFDWIAARNSTYQLGATPAAVQKAYLDEMAKLRAAPQGILGGSELNDVFVTAAYAEALWVPIAAGLADLIQGDAALFTRIYTILESPGDDNGYAAFNATACTDAPYAPYDKTRRDAYVLEKGAPLAVWQSYWFSAPCSFWPVKAGTQAPVDGAKVSIPILLVNATADAATPYKGALAVRKEFPTAALVAQVGGTTHAGSLSTGDACTANIVADYLETGALPARVAGLGPDVKCARVPLPEPSPIDRSLPKGHLGEYLGAPEPFTALLNMIPA